MNHLPLAPDIRWYAQIETGLIASAVIEGVHRSVAGACEYVLVWRALHNPRGRYGAWVPATGLLATLNSWFPMVVRVYFSGTALAWQRYMHRYGATREHLATFVTNSRRNANRNPNAYFYTTPMTREDYLAARWIAEPSVCLTAIFRLKAVSPSS